MEVVVVVVETDLAKTAMPHVANIVAVHQTMMLAMTARLAADRQLMVVAIIAVKSGMAKIGSAAMRQRENVRLGGVDLVSDLFVHDTEWDSLNTRHWC